MVRIVVDTNVIVSRFLSKIAAPQAVFQAIFDQRVDLILSPEVRLEYRDVLNQPHIFRRHGLNSMEIDKAISLIENRAKLVFPVVTLSVVPADEKDNKFVECAVAWGAEFIVTGDKHLLSLEQYDGIQIVTPASFVAYLNSFGET